MDSKTYWKNREETQRQKYIKDEAAYQKEIEEIYDYMLDQIQREINGFYAKYAKKEGITLSEAKKRVSKLDMESYERKAARYVKEKNFSEEANEEMRLYNATMKINRLEMLKANIGLELVDGFNDLQKYFDTILTDRTLSEFKRQAGILGKTIRNNEKAAYAIVNASFHNAKFSDRIWMYQDMLKNELAQLLRTGLIQGKNPRELARHLTKRFGVAKENAERLMRTELARVQTEAQKQSYERNGFEEYEFIALGSACPICRDLDGKHFKVKDMMPGENAPPTHPNCRCSTAAHMDEKEYREWLDGYKKHGLSFEDWKRINVGENLELSDSTDKWSREARSELLKDEESLSRRKKETAVIYDENGKYLFTKRGNEKHVLFARSEISKMRNGIVTHNHPSNGSFSVSDWKLFKNASLQELRAIADDGVYYLRRTDKFSNIKISDEELEKEIKKIRKQVKQEYQKLYESGRINKTERFLLSSDEYNKIFAEKLGLEYGKEMF